MRRCEYPCRSGLRRRIDARRGVLHDVLEDTQVTADELEQKFGKEVLELVEGVTKLDKIKFVSAEDEQAENLRKMFLRWRKITASS